MTFAEYVKIRQEKFGAVVFETLKEKIFVTNKAGRDILNLLSQGYSIEKIVDSLARDYEANNVGIIKNDVVGFINQLKDNNILLNNSSNPTSPMNLITFEDLNAPLFIAWQINSACNLECLHCCEEAGHSIPNELNKNEVFYFLQQIVELKIPYVALSGGEPLLHPHFFEICEFLRKHNISLKVETNGEFVDGKIAERIAGLKFRSVQISLDGATSFTHEKLRLAGDWNKSVAACRSLIREGVNTEVVFVPTKFNIHEIGELLDLAYSLGVYGVYTGKMMRIGRAAQNWDILCPSDKEYEKFFAVLNDKIARYDGKMKVYYYPYDVIEELKYRLKYPSASVLVIPNGKVKLIGPLPFICGDLKKESLAKIWESYKKAWSNPKVIKFAKKVIADPKLLAESNKSREV